MAQSKAVKQAKQRDLAAQRRIVCDAVGSHQRYVSGNGEIICTFCGARDLEA